MTDPTSKSNAGRGSPSQRRRVFAFVAFSGACVLGAGAYVVSLRQRLAPPAVSVGGRANATPPVSGARSARAAAPPGFPNNTPATGPVAAARLATLSAVVAQPHVLFRSARRADFGAVAAVGVTAPAGESAGSSLKCARIHFAKHRGLCLTENQDTPHPPARGTIVNDKLEPLFSFDLSGSPSRARMSPDARYAASTVFEEGHDYLAEFSTRTLLIDVAQGKVIANLEDFEAYKGGQRFRSTDFNYWGVTFEQDSQRFYATLASKGRTYLVRGSIPKRRVEVLRTNVECPSLAPDGQHLAFKSREPGVEGWRLHVLELATKKEWPVTGELRSVDDQVEWLDNQHILYGIADSRGLPERALNIWLSPIARSAGKGAPEPKASVFIAAASSPAVVR